MFRKRKDAAPYFRLPQPNNPITGSHEYLYPPLKTCTRFKLTEAMTTTDEIKKAEITDAGQWGPNPIFHVSGVVIHVHNQLADDDTTYIFSGSIGDVGIALHDYANHWRIITLGKPAGLIGGCLAEAHPGRGTAFDIHLGVWDASDASGGKWIYAAGATVKAIDWRFDVPEPGDGATGLFEARKSDLYDTIWEVVALDCSSPGACGD
jgi:hypothetical protein